MKKAKLSLAVIGCLMATGLNADGVSLAKAFESGSISTDGVLYIEKQNNNGSNDDAGFSSGSVGLNYETSDYHGIKVAIGFRGNHDFSELEDGDYAGGSKDPKALLHTANISYNYKNFFFSLGRQEIDFEWAGDFHESYIASFTGIPDTTIILAHTVRMGVADPDAMLESFDKVNGNEGVTFADIKYEGIEGLGLNTYYYIAKDVANWYGLKVDYDTNIFGTTTHYAGSNEDTVGADTGSILHLEGRGYIADFALNAGYIITDKDVGVGSMEAIGDNINPLEDGNQVYVADADTIYLGAEYAFSAVTLAGMYGFTKYGSDDKKEKELNFSTEYAMNEKLTLGALFVGVNAENIGEDYNRVSFTAKYNF